MSASNIRTGKHCIFMSSTRRLNSFSYTPVTHLVGSLYYCQYQGARNNSICSFWPFNSCLDKNYLPARAFEELKVCVKSSSLLQDEINKTLISVFMAWLGSQMTLNTSKVAQSSNSQTRGSKICREWSFNFAEMYNFFQKNEDKKSHCRHIQLSSERKPLLCKFYCSFIPCPSTTTVTGGLCSTWNQINWFW